MHNNNAGRPRPASRASSAKRTPPTRRHGGLIIFDYEDPTGRWLDARSTPFGDAEMHIFRPAPASERIALATLGARAASRRIRAGDATLFATSRPPLPTIHGADPLGQLVSIAAMGVSDPPAYTLILAPGRWRQHLEPSGIPADVSASKIDGTADLWRPHSSGLTGTAPIVWRGASETETIADVTALLARLSRGITSGDSSVAC